MSVESITVALQITVMGMGLVLAMILLLWAVIAVLVWFTTQDAAAPLTPIVTGIRSQDRKSVV